MDIKDYIQVAGVIDQAEAELLVKCGVRYLGFPLRLPVHREDLSEEAASLIIRSLEPAGLGVLITYLNQASEIVEFCNLLGVSIVQLHGNIEATEAQDNQRAATGFGDHKKPRDRTASNSATT